MRADPATWVVAASFCMRATDGARCCAPETPLLPNRATTHISSRLPMLRVLSRPSARALRMAQPCRLMSTKFSKV